MNYPTTLYRYYREDGVLLYIGIAYDFKGRLENHRLSKDWYYEIKFVRLDHYESRVEAQTAELQAIAIEKPRYNGTSNLRYRRDDLKRSRKVDRE